MRFLLHHSDATYDSDTKTYWFTLDQRISNPKELTVRKASYTAATATTYPHAIYLRSDALNSMILSKHTVELKKSHAQANVICVLHETHSGSRYRTIHSDSWRTHEHLHTTRIDIQFTDGATVLTGEQDSAAAGESSAEADDQSIIDLDDEILLWLDMDYSPLSTQSTLVTEDGENIAYLRNKYPGSAQMFFTATADDFVLASMGETKMMIGGPNVSWAFAEDQSGVPVTVPVTLFFIFRVPPTTTYQSIVNMPNEMFKIAILNNNLQYKDHVGTQAIDNVTFLSGEDWYVQVTCHDPDGDATANFSWKFVNMAYPTVEIAELTAGNILGPTDSSTDWDISKANDHFTCGLGPIIMLESGGPEKIATVKAWMLAKYATAAGEGGEASTAADAAFQIELEIATS